MKIASTLTLVSSVLMVAAGLGEAQQGDRPVVKAPTQPPAVPNRVVAGLVAPGPLEGLTIEQLIAMAEGVRGQRVELELGPQAGSKEAAKLRTELAERERNLLEAVRDKIGIVRHRADVLMGTEPPPPPRRAPTSSFDFSAGYGSRYGERPSINQYVK